MTEIVLAGVWYKPLQHARGDEMLSVPPTCT